MIEEQENESGAFDYERWAAEADADPGYRAWLDFLDAKTKQERDNAESHRYAF
jgi:hypothetical protein